MPEQIIRPAAPASGRVTPASFPFYTTGEDNLRIISFNAAAGVTLKINARTLDSAGRATPDSWDHTPNSDRSAKISDFQLSGTTPLNITVFANAGAPLVGQTFVIVQLIRGMGVGALVLGTILQGYVTGQQALAWPGSAIVSSTDGEPAVRSILGSAPAVGLEIAETVPAGARWELLQFTFGFTTSAAPANRLNQLQFTVGGVPIGYAMNSTTIPAGTVNVLTFAVNSEGLSYPAFGTYQAGMGARLILPAGSVINTAGIADAGDHYTAPKYLVREWLEVA